LARISDLIEEFIKQMINRMDGVAEIQRNELAEQFHCVPSQINYVIDTRFGHDQGYYVVSRRGGGGHIRIVRAYPGDQGSYMAHLIATLEEQNLSQHSAELLLTRLAEDRFITRREGMFLAAALSDKALTQITPQDRNAVRAAVMRNVLARIAVEASQKPEK